MQLEEFENKIKDLWMKPIDELENPEFIKYCDTFFETNNEHLSAMYFLFSLSQSELAQGWWDNLDR